MADFSRAPLTGASLSGWSHDNDEGAPEYAEPGCPSRPAGKACLQISEADTAAQVRDLLAADWGSLVRLSLIEGTVERADALAWELDLRGYDAVHLATAVQWANSMAETPLLATYDRELWKAAQTVGLQAWPASFEGG